MNIPFTKAHGARNGFLLTYGNQSPAFEFLGCRHIAIAIAIPAWSRWMASRFLTPVTFRSPRPPVAIEI